MARGARCATAIMSGYDAGDASARRKTPRESSMICPPSRQAYRSRGCTPCARAASVVNVDGSESSNSFMDTILAQNAQLCVVFIHHWSLRCAQRQAISRRSPWLRHHGDHVSARRHRKLDLFRLGLCVGTQSSELRDFSTAQIPKALRWLEMQQPTQLMKGHRVRPPSRLSELKHRAL